VLAARRKGALASVASAIEAEGGSAFGVPTDVADEEEVQRLFDTVGERWGRLDVLVNNAGIAGPVASIGEIDKAAWDETLAVNLTGPWLCCRAAGTMMMERGGGRIINIGSISGKRPLAQRTPYCASKMGLLGLTRALALELGPSNINVNCLSPGAVETPRLELLAEKAKTPFAEFLQLVAKGSALQRVTQPPDVASLVVYLASDEAHNITGQDFTIDAGTFMD
jgi:NAD(P)-dependent dehydrogenase (short-subunit alcohol dehydrogenase family)